MLILFQQIMAHILSLLFCLIFWKCFNHQIIFYFLLLPVSFVYHLFVMNDFYDLAQFQGESKNVLSAFFLKAL